MEEAGSGKDLSRHLLLGVPVGAELLRHQEHGV